MGNTFTVTIWRRNEYAPFEFGTEVLWQGENLLFALYKLFVSKHKHPDNCIKLEWR